MLELQRWLYGEASTQLKTLASGMEPLTVLAGVCIAALFGLVHAIMLGHGKTVLVSYFLGRPATVFTGLATSIILVLTHVGSAVLLVVAAARPAAADLGQATAGSTRTACATPTRCCGNPCEA
jgi:nickel/cobalt transporter (NicO) family protein